MSGMGEALGDFIKGLYWLIGGLVVLVLILTAVIVWLVVT